jgi:hypothetical protein
MSDTTPTHRPHHWGRGAIDAGAVAGQGRAGDTIAPRGREDSWLVLRRRLRARGLLVLPAGRRLFLVPHDARLAGLIDAAAADDNPVASSVLRDCARDVLDGELAAALEAVYARAAVDRPVPGGPSTTPTQSEWEQAEGEKRYAAYEAAEAKRARPRKGLSALERSLLLFLSDYGYREHAPLAGLRAPATRAAAAARSRAWRRLERRGLVEVRRQGGRATHARLTFDGREAINC